jgi:hypothetical protein
MEELLRVGAQAGLDLAAALATDDLDGGAESDVDAEVAAAEPLFAKRPGRGTWDWRPWLLRP